MRASRIIGAGAVLVLGLAACGGSDEPSGGGPAPTTSGPAGSSNAVEVKDLSFKPQSLTVAAGTVVTWTNQDDFPHTVTSGNPNDAPSGLFDSPLESKGSSATFRFATAGTITYYCKLHPQMTGTVTVS